MDASAQTRELCSLVSELAHAIDEHVRSCVADSELTSTQAVALRELAEPLSMRELAARMHCATSNVTFVVDRLEEQGLVAREPHPTDRRSKRLVLTAEGARQREVLLSRLAEDSPLGDLGEHERNSLHTLLQRALARR
ncbi:MarR family winged helix-turn-helix transcriptional regulator [Saccharopolyspora rosea]|uniref:MarR family winged helix-turn-helix transcriptional regulator n=1 Tax=Saccharopolyspora rosea TaxID=524884 RepID=A0ABW3FT50_9PSEU|nr:MarR family transcriptional regulator [Saccharopolyspora rosea]